MPYRIKETITYYARDYILQWGLEQATGKTPVVRNDTKF